MTLRNEDIYDPDRNDSYGGEAQPRPHKAQRLTDLLGEENASRSVKPSSRPPCQAPSRKSPSVMPHDDPAPTDGRAPSTSEKEEDPLKRAIQKGLDILTRGDLSARRLAEKLMEKGCERETAIRATKYLMDKGYIRERETACRFAEQGRRKGWGIRRISEDLRAKGFAPKALQSALDNLADVDWVDACLQVMTKRYGTPPEDAHGRQKLTAALFRLGYDPETIRSAMERAMRDDK